MKNINKLRLIVLLPLFVIFTTPTLVNAKESITYNDSLYAENVNVVLTNKQTGEKIEFKDDIKPVIIKKTNRSNDDSEKYEAIYDVFVKFENNKPVSITPRASSSFGKEDAGVRAYVSVYYTLNSNNTKISITKISGGWTPESLYLVSDRRVVLKQSFYGKSMSKTPSSNSFEYETGWGYVSFVSGGKGPSFTTQATISVPGMSGSSYYLELQNNFPQIS